MVEDSVSLVDQVDERALAEIPNLICPGCGEKGFVLLSRSGPHIKASCAGCGAYIKFCRQKLPPAERAYWDSRKSP